MPLTTFDPTPKPSPGTALTQQIKILEAEFGDGYTQATPDGINHIRQQVELKWDALTESQMQVIIGFFVARRAVEAFYYQPAGEVSPLKWTCKEWSRSTENGIWKVQAKFMQSFTNLT